MLQRLGGLLGWFARVSGSRMARVTEENIRSCFPALTTADQDRLIRLSLGQTGNTIMESAFAWQASPERCRAAIIAVEGKQLADEALASGNGVVFVLPHLGNWELINHHLGEAYGLTHMYLPNKSRRLDDFIQACRSRTGTRFVPADTAGMRTQLKALRNGGCIGVMPDQEPEVFTGEFAPFFGQAALTSTLVPGLLKRSGAAAFTVVCKRLDHGAGFKVVYRQVSIASTQDLNRAIQASVVDCPEQYLWSYKRFRTRPAGDSERYEFSQHTPVNVTQRVCLDLLLRGIALVPTATHRPLARLIQGYLLARRGKHVKVATRNLNATTLAHEDKTKLMRDSLFQLGLTAVECPAIWYRGDPDVEGRIRLTQGLEYLGGHGAIVMTPPLGQRELVQRYLGANYATTEYYHPATIPAVDQLIRRARSRTGIRLVRHTSCSVETLVERLSRGEVVTLCPDQQPRLRGGAFVPFLGVDALTTLAIPELVRRTNAALVFGVALRVESGFDLHFEECVIEPGSSDEVILNAVNSHLGEIISHHQDQYRWSDKRFNIQPQGKPRLYRG